MIECLTTIFNKVDKERQTPLQRRETATKSLHKGGGSKEKIQEIQIGIFITNIVPKACEIVKNKPEQSSTKQHVQYAECRKEN